jgi:flavin-dependent dehydrogenase
VVGAGPAGAAAAVTAVRSGSRVVLVDAEARGDPQRGLGAQAIREQLLDPLP